MKKLFLALLLLVFPFYVFAVGLITLEPMEHEGTTLSIDRGAAIVYSQVGDEYVGIVGGEIDDSGLGTFIVTIINNSSSPVVFRDSQIEIYGKEEGANSWKLMQVWSADAYYDKTARRIESDKFWTGVAGSLSVASASLGSYSSSSIYGSTGNSYSISTRTYNPADVAIASMVANMNYNQVASLGKMELNSLKQNLLFSSQIQPYETYTGFMGVDIPRYGFVDFKVKYSSTNGSVQEFYFSRSDRDDAVSIFADQTYHAKNSVDLMVDLTTNYYDIVYTYNSPDSIGGYFGFGFGSGGKIDYSPLYTDEFSLPEYSSYYEEVEILKPGKGFDMPFGITYKVAPYTWMMLGGSLCFREAVTKYEHKTNHSIVYARNGDIDNMFDFEIQLGANVIYGPISLIAMGDYDIRYKCFGFKLGSVFGY